MAEMADTPPAPVMDAPPPTAAPAPPPAAPEPSDDFKSPESKAAVLADLKKARDEKAALAKQLQDIEDRDKTDGEKLTERVTAAEKRADDAEQRALRMEVATSKGLSAAQAKRLVGTTQDELEADADEILETLRPAEPETPGAAPKRRPSELKPGAVPGAEPEPDYDAIADAARRW